MIQVTSTFKMNKNDAEKIVERELNLDSLNCSIISESTEEFSKCFAVHYQSKRYIESKKFDDMLVGHGPVLVEKKTGKLYETGSAFSTEHYVEAFEETSDPFAEKSNNIKSVMHFGQIILLLGMSLIIGIPMGIWTQIPKWIIVTISPVLAIISINLIDCIVSLLERQKTPHEYGGDIDEERKHRILKEAHDEINRELDMKLPCNECGSTDVVLILYGLADLDEEMKSMIDEGKITLGGCMVDKDSPKWVCNDCKHKYGTLG